MMLMDCVLHYLRGKKGMVDYQLGLLYMRAEENRVVMNISYIMPNPQKKYGEWRLSINIAPSILSTDYKSPPIVVECYEQ